MKSKKYEYTWEELEEEGKTPFDLAMKVINDEELPVIEEIIIGQFTPGYDVSAQEMLDVFVANKDKLQHIRSLFIGDMDYEQCEVSWIEQGNYEELISSLPNLEKLTIKGSIELTLGKVYHENLRELEIICGGLPKNVIKEIRNSYLPNLEKLRLYIGVDEYGFDGDIEDIKSLLNKDLFPKLNHLGIMDSEIQDEVVEATLNSNIIEKLEELSFSYGTLTDKGGQIILDKQDKLKHLKMLDLEYHFLSDKMMNKLSKMGININLDEQMEADEYDGEIYYWPMLTE